jgi:hypothetical protein
MPVLVLRARPAFVFARAREETPAFDQARQRA